MITGDGESKVKMEVFIIICKQFYRFLNLKKIFSKEVL